MSNKRIEHFLYPRYPKLGFADVEKRQTLKSRTSHVVLISTLQSSQSNYYQPCSLYQEKTKILRPLGLMITRHY